jgi:fatty acid desaturase
MTLAYDTRRPGAALLPDLRRLEWPTLGLAAAIYAGWAAATLLGDRLNPWVLAAAGGWLLAWHGSLQHEAIHGHPTPWAWVNTAIALPALSLWLPYQAYRDTHLQHHASEHLTDPAFDPESRYLAPGTGLSRRLDAWASRLQSSLLGRMAFGPLVEVARFWRAQALAIRFNEGDARRTWALHLVGVAAIAAWLHFACAMTLGRYLMCFVYPGLVLSLIRSFAEHRADPEPGHRVAIVENAPILGLLFLHNNLHAAHHAWPGLAWWRLPKRYRQHRGALIAGNGGLVYNGYAEVFARFLLRPHDVSEHPAGRAD